MANFKKILIAPLDWGLGHVSRCISIIHHLKAQGHHVFFAGNAKQQQMIQELFPDIHYLNLSGYAIQYPNKGWKFMLKMALQVPKFIKAYKHEKKWIATQMNDYHFDIIISDNRYGLYHPYAVSILMTHQLQIQTGNFLSDYCIQKINNQLLQPFNHKWIVDDATNTLAGKLSSSANTNQKLTYIGWLSQCQSQTPSKYIIPFQKYTLAIISGPEPFRSQFETLLIAQMKMLSSNKYIIIAGKTTGTIPTLPNHIHYIAFANASLVKLLMQNAAFIISRSGYSTVMDLVYLKKQAVLIPTPGQTEQIYIAKHLQSQKKFNMYEQGKFDLSKAILASAHYENDIIFTSNWQEAFTSIFQTTNKV